jgi:hypothetical protein
VQRRARRAARRYGPGVLRPLGLSLLVVTGALLATAGEGAPPTGLALEASASAPVRLAPLPPAPAADEPDAPHAFAAERRDATGRPVLFDPCRPVHWALRRDGELPGSEAVVEQAADDVARATGLRLVRLPDVTGPLPDGRALAQRRADGSFPPAVVSWANGDERPGLAGGTVALGGGTTWAPPGRSGEERLVSGLVVLDAEDLSALDAGPDSHERLRGVLRHELAHLVGLGHVDDPSQLLHPHAEGTAFGAGDLRGLRAAGDGQCFQDW